MINLEKKLFYFVGYDWIGDGQKDAPPLTNDTLQLPMYKGAGRDDVHVISLLNDAHEIWFGYPHSWKFHISRKDLHKIIRWYIGRYIFGEWLGIRRKLYYKLLHRRVERFKQSNYKDSKQYKKPPKTNKVDK